jgi:hypothetical protein
MEADNEGVDDDSQQQQQQEAAVLPQQQICSSDDAAGSSSSELAAADAGAAFDSSGIELQLLSSSAQSVGDSSIPCQLPQGAEGILQRQQVDSGDLQQKHQLVATNAAVAAADAAAAALAEQAGVASSTGSVEAAVELRMCPKGSTTDKTAGSKLAAADEHAAASVAATAAGIASDEAATAPAAEEDEWTAANRQRLAELQQQQVSCG